MKKNNTKANVNVNQVNTSEFASGVICGALLMFATEFTISAVRSGITAYKEVKLMKKAAKQQAVFNQFVQKTINEHNRMLTN